MPADATPSSPSDPLSTAPWRALAEALERDAPPEELREGFRQACAGPRGIPDDLVERYQQRLAQWRHRRRQRWLVGVGGALALILVIGIVGAAAWDWIERDRRRVGYLMRLDAFMAAEDWESVERMLADLPHQEPRLAVDPELQMRAALCAERRVAESARKERFRELLSRAENAPPSESTPPSLEEADRLARTAEEQSAVQAVRDRRRQSATFEKRHQVELQRQAMAELGRRIGELSVRLDQEQIEPEAETLLDQWDAALVKAMQSGSGVDPALVKQADEFRHQLPGLRARHQRLVKETKLLEQLSLALRPEGAPLDAVERFAEALEAYRREGKVDGRQVDFKAAAERLPAWRAAAAWQAIWQGWAEPGIDLPIPEAMRRAEVCQRYVNEHPLGPAVSTARKLALWWSTQALQRPDVANSPAQKFERLLNDPLLSDLWVVPTTDGRVYYVRKDPTRDIEAKRSAEVGQPSVKLSYVTDFDGSTRDVHIPVAKLTKCHLAPQAKLFTHFRQLRRVGSVLAAWDEAIPHLLTAIQECSDMEPLLQLALLRRLTLIGSEGSVALADALTEHRARLEKMKPSVQLATRWMDPQATDALAERTKAVAVLKQLPPFAKVKDRVQVQAKQLEQQLRAERHELWGWLRRGPRQTWEAVRLGPSDEATLYVVTLKGSQARWEPVGRAGPGGIQLTVPDETPEGQLIFSVAIPNR